VLTAVIDPHVPAHDQGGDADPRLRVSHRIAQPGSADLEYGPRVVGADLKRPEHRDLHTCIVPDSGSYARLARSG
jgi:hypothetical protein